MTFGPETYGLGLVADAGQRLLQRVTIEGPGGQLLVGLVLVVLGTLIVTHADQRLQAWVLDHTPDWLTALTTRF